MNGRRKPYTEIGIKRLKCIRCKEPAFHQWKCCADGLWRSICEECDYALNKIAMEFMKPENWRDNLRRYFQR